MDSRSDSCRGVVDGTKANFLFGRLSHFVDFSMTDVDSNFLSPESILKRTSSEPDIFGSGIRHRTCSNSSQLQYNRARERSRASFANKERSRSPSPPNGILVTDYEGQMIVDGSSLNDSCASDEFSFRDRAPTSPSREEVKAQAFDRLQEELKKAQEELKLKDEECEKLSRVRNELEAELEELTASLFQEAHAMVRAAKVKQAAAEKRFKEANNKVEVLQAEVTALKQLVLTSASSPGHKKGMGYRRHSTEHLSPCVECGSYDCDAAVARFNGTCAEHSHHRGDTMKDEPEVDVILFREFLQWMDERSVSHDQPFLARIYKEDVGPCLNFPNKELALAVHSAIENNTLMMETFTGKPLFRKCALTGTSRFCVHRVKLTEKGDWYNLSRNSRVRIVAVCDFYTYVRYIQQGLIKADVTEIYWEIMRLRGQMALARLGLETTCSGKIQKNSSQS